MYLLSKIGEELVLKQAINAHADSWVTSLTFLPNGDLVSGLFKEIRIYTNNNNFNNDYTLKQILTAHSNNVVSLISLEASVGDEFASSETSIAQSSIRIWKRNKLSTVTPYFSLKNEIKLVDKLDSPLVQLPNGHLAAASFNTIHIWDIVENNGTLIHELSAKDESGFIRVITAWKRGDNKHVYMASGSDDTTISIWKCV